MKARALESLRALEASLRDEVTRAFHVAWSVDEPAGQSDAWAAVLAQAGVTPLSHTERDEVRAAQSPLRGAPTVELYEVLRRIARRAELDLGRIDASEAPAEARELEVRLRQAVDLVGTRAVDAYKSAVLPRRRGMFANATAHAGAALPSQTGAVAPVLDCQSCGAPRLREGRFDCVFCGQRMA